MRSVIARIFRFLFRFEFFKKRFFGIYKHILIRFNLVRGVTQEINYHGLKLTLLLDDWIQANLFFLNEYEEAELKVLDKLVKKDSVFLDLGANIGLYSLRASKIISENGKIISFEPFSVNHDAFANHIKNNQITTIQLEKKAVGQESGTLDLYLPTEERNLGMVTATPLPNAVKETVEVITIDEYFDKHPIKRLDVVKIDIEGYEYPTLIGMKKTIKQFQPILFLEVLDQEENSEKVIQFLEEFGYKKYFITNEGTLSSEQQSNRKNYLWSCSPLTID